MISKQERSLWILFAGMLVILFLLSSTDLIIKEKKTVVYPVSILLGDTSDDYYENFRKGADKAADDYHVDVSYLTLYEKYDSDQQMELLKREIHDGARAVIIMPVQPSKFVKELDGMAVNCPLVIIGAMVSHESVKSGISMDYWEAGSKLGEALVKRHEPNTPVFLFTEGLEYSYNQNVYDGLKSELEKSQFDITLYSRSTERNFQEVIDAAACADGTKPVLAALDITSLEEVSDYLSSGTMLDLYGIGSTTRILNKLDQGIIKGLVVRSQFEEGYLSVEKAIEAISNRSDAGQVLLDSYYIEQKDIRQFEKILYPID